MGDLLDHRSWLVAELFRLGVPLDQARWVVAGLRVKATEDKVERVMGVLRETCPEPVAASRSHDLAEACPVPHPDSDRRSEA